MPGCLWWTRGQNVCDRRYMVVRVVITVGSSQITSEHERGERPVDRPARRLQMVMRD